MRLLGSIALLCVGSALQICATASETHATDEADLRAVRSELMHLQRQVEIHRSQLVVLQNRLSRLHEQGRAFATLTDVLHRDAAGDLVVDGANLRIVNGEGRTQILNGRGNLMIGYDAARIRAADRGSHNIIIGPNHVVHGHSAIVSGSGNSILGGHAVAIGTRDALVDRYGVVLGGGSSAAMGPGSVVIAGFENHALAANSTVVGGHRNTASGRESVVVGASGHKAARPLSTIVGGTPYWMPVEPGSDG